MKLDVLTGLSRVVAYTWDLGRPFGRVLVAEALHFDEGAFVAEFNSETQDVEFRFGSVVALTEWGEQSNDVSAGPAWSAWIGADCAPQPKHDEYDVVLTLDGRELLVQWCADGYPLAKSQVTR
jgi:hypothetical protein